MILAFDDHEIDDARFELRRGGVKQAVQPKVFDFLLFVVKTAIGSC